MTVEATRTAPAPAARHDSRTAPSRARRRDRGRLAATALGALVVLITGWFLGQFQTAAGQHAGAATYTAPLGTADWIRAASPASASWFRTVLTLPAKPTAATLWVDADQTFQIWVNGHRGPTNRLAVRDAVAPSVHALDIRAGLRPGDNVIAIAVATTGTRSAAVIASLDLRYPDGTGQTIGTTPLAWRATSDASLIGAGAGAPAYSLASLPLDSWPLARDESAVRTAQSSVPPAVMDLPYTARVLGPQFSDDPTGTVFRTRLVTGAHPDGWLRIACRGLCSVYVGATLVDRIDDTHAVSTGTGVAVRRGFPLHLLRIGPVLDAGSNALTVRVDGPQPAVYVDGAATWAGGQTAIRSAPGWTAATSGGAGPSVGTAVGPAADLGPAEAIWPSGFLRTADVALAIAPAGRSGADGILAAAVLGLGWAAAGLLAARRGALGVTTGLRRALIAVLPLAGMLLVLDQVSRLASGYSWSPGRPGTVVGLWSLAAAGLVAVVVRSGLGRPARSPYGSGPGSPTWGGSGATGFAEPAVGGRVVSGRRVKPGQHRARRRLTRVARWGWARWAVIVTAAAGAGINASELRHEPLWQDEVTSIIAAQSIRRHGLPELPSGLYYFKGELYHALLAAVMSITTDVTALRAVSVVWFAATVLAFGLLLMPTLLPGRRVAHAAATVLLTFSPMETVWARDIRMYQQMQFFAVVFLALFLRALTEGRRRQIVGSALVLLAMYLSHEESYVVLPVVPILLLLRWRTRWWATRAWSLAYIPVGLVISCQVVLSRLHPVIFGSDLSNRPYVGWDPDQASFYYQHVLFRPLAPLGSLAFVATLAVLASVVGLCGRQTPRKLATVALLTMLATMSVLFTVKIERYLFVAIPLIIALGVIGAVDLTDAARRLVGVLPSTAFRALSLPISLVLLLSMGGAPEDFGLLAARLTDTPVTAAHPDYRPAAAYVRAHWRPGDSFITLSPPDIPAYYLGRTPDRIIQTGRNKLLYVIESHGTAVDTIYGVPVVLTGAAMVSYLASTGRVWLVSDTGSALQGLPLDLRSAVTSHFRLVEQGSGATVYEAP